MRADGGSNEIPQLKGGVMDLSEFLGNCVHCDALAYWNNEDECILWVRSIPGCVCELSDDDQSLTPNWRRTVKNVRKMYDLGRGK